MLLSLCVGVCVCINNEKLENVAINNVLPPKAACLDATANMKCFWGPGHHRPNSDGFIYTHYAAPSYSAITIIIASKSG